MSDQTHRFPPEKMHLLDTPERRKLMPAEELLRMVPVQKEDTVVDLGAGTGYFAISAAKMTSASVYAVDVEPMMLEVLQTRAAEHGLANVFPTVGAIETIPLREGVADVVIVSMVLHAVKPLRVGLREIHRILRDGGKILCIDWEPKESPMGPPLEVRISSLDMEKALEEEGFLVSKRRFPAEFLYVFIAEKSAQLVSCP